VYPRRMRFNMLLLPDWAGRWMLFTGQLDKPERRTTTSSYVLAAHVGTLAHQMKQLIGEVLWMWGSESKAHLRCNSEMRNRKE